MIIQYPLDENDFLTHQLYIASKSERIKKKRKRSRLIVPVAYAVMAMLFYYQGKVELMLLFLIIALCWYTIYPSWERKKYERHYLQFISENYKIRIGRMATLSINNDCFMTKDNGGESKILTSETEEIVEIPSLILVRLKSGQSLIIPKNKIDNADEVRITLKELAGILKINYIVEDSWKWS